ncbi:MAG: serine hydrolase domain-containing protein [Promethearchaeota archaeon]
MIKENFAEEVDELFKQWDKPDTPGCALAIIKDGKIIYKKGYGMADLEHDVPITPKTTFNIGSITKQFTAMCILLLVEQGKMSLDDDIRKYLPKFPEYGQMVKIRHLVNHTSGIRDFAGLLNLKGINLLEASNRPKHEVRNMLFKQRELNFTPGEEMLYSNSGYLMLEAIIEKVTRKSFREFAEENIFKPLGMKNTNFIDDNKYIIKNRAFGYIPDGKNGYFNKMISHKVPGMIYSNVEDLILWDFNYHNNKLGKGGQDLIKTMQTPAKLNNGEEVSYAFGLAIGKYKGQKTILHGGGVGGYRAIHVSFPKYKLSVIILANITNVMAESLTYKIADKFLQKFFKSEQPEISVDPNIYHNFLGKYYSDTLGTVSISCKNNELLIEASLGFPPLKLITESKTSFFTEFPSKRITVQNDEENKYSEFILYEQGKESKIKRLESSKLSLEELEGYDGRYYSEELDQTYILRINKNSLYISNFEMVFAEKDKFLTDWAVFKFKRGKNGNIEGFKLNAGRVRNLWFKRK